MKKKEDYFGTVLDNEDMVIAYFNNKMELGVIIDNKIRTLSSIKHAVSTKYLYYLDEPTEKELKIKEKIIEKYNKYQQEKKSEQNNYGKLIGGIYSTNQNKYVLYLGNLVFTRYRSDGSIYSQSKGHCYYVLSDLNKIKSSNITDMINTYYLYFQKNFKKVNGLCGMIEKFKDPKNICGNYLFKYYNFDKHQSEIGKCIVELNS